MYRRNNIAEKYVAPFDSEVYLENYAAQDTYYAIFSI
jgi:hypothetical protein